MNVPFILALDHFRRNFFQPRFQPRSQFPRGARVVIAGWREDDLKRAVAALGAAVSHVRHDVTDHTAAGRLVAPWGASEFQSWATIIHWPVSPGA